MERRHKLKQLLDAHGWYVKVVNLDTEDEYYPVIAFGLMVEVIDGEEWHSVMPLWNYDYLIAPDHQTDVLEYNEQLLYLPDLRLPELQQGMQVRIKREL